jgi:dCTP diphosphatase
VEVGCPDFTSDEKLHLGQELSDVLIYLIRLADKCHIDLPLAAIEKIQLNGVKYPASVVRGSSKKYDEYHKK